MVVIKELILYLVYVLYFHVGADEKLDYSCNINIKRPVNYVSDKFLSISIDPAVLLAGMNLSDTSLRIAQHFKPAYIRLAGPSTEFVKYVEEENFPLQDNTCVTITPSIWFGINEWLSLTQLIPIYGINDAETINDVWNPKSFLPLLDISDQLNVTCLWQLGYDSTNKTEMRYKQDLSLLQHLLNAYPSKRDTWKIIGSDLNTISGDRSENMIQDLDGIVDAVMWEPKGISEENFLKDDFTTKFWPKHVSNIGVWTTIPKSEGPITFASVLTYAMQIGDAAKFGYEVVFRQPRMHELLSDTPAYWFSLVFKKLMGRTVLEMKNSHLSSRAFTYAHCTRNQNSYVRRGAVTILAVNEEEIYSNVKVKFGGAPPPEKTMEVQEYILTASDLNSTDICLNEVSLTKDFLHRKDPFLPKVRRAKTTSHILISLPPHSVGFYVIPDARLQVCVDNEEETEMLMKEIEEDQNSPFSEELELILSSRSSFGRNSRLEEITEQLKDELVKDEQYYLTKASMIEPEKVKEEKEGITMKSIENNSRKFLIDRAKSKKHLDFENRRNQLKKIIKARMKGHKMTDNNLNKGKTTEVLEEQEKTEITETTNVPKIAERSSAFTDAELERLILEASKKFVTSKIKRDINIPRLKQILESNVGFETENVDNQMVSETKDHSRKPRHTKTRLELRNRIQATKQKIIDRKDQVLQNVHNKKEIIANNLKNIRTRNKFQRIRRDINMDLLKLKAEDAKKKIQKNDTSKIIAKKSKEKEATLREPGQTSDEFLEEMELLKSEENTKPPKKSEIFAELAAPEDEYADDFFSISDNSRKNIFSDKKVKDIFDNNRAPGEKRKTKTAKSDIDDLQFLTSSAEFTDIEEGLPCLHEYFGKKPEPLDKQWKKVIYELGEFSSNEKKKKNQRNKEKNEYELQDDDFDIEDDFRRKRSVNSPENVSKITNLGQLLYPDIFGSTPEKVDGIQGVSSVGEFLYPSQFENNKLDGDEIKITPLKTNDQFSPLQTKSLEDTTGVITQNPLPLQNESLRKSVRLEIHDSNETDNKYPKVPERASNLLDDTSKQTIESGDASDSANVHGHDTSGAHTILTKSAETNKTNVTHNNFTSRTTEASAGPITYRTEELSNELNMDNAYGIKKNISKEPVKEDSKDDKSERQSKTLLNTDSVILKSRNFDASEDDRSGLASVQKPLKKWMGISKKHDKLALPDLLVSHNIKNDLKSYQEDVKEHMKEIHDLLELDKKKFEQEKEKNRMKLLELQKKQQELINVENGIIAKQVEDNKNELFKQMDNLKKTLQKRKNEIDAMTLKNLHDLYKNDLKKTLATIHLEKSDNSLEKKSKMRNKRSLFKTVPFGLYQPHSLDLKPWTTADILSLKRDMFLRRSLEAPPNDNQIFKNILDNNKIYYRKKRNIEILDNFINDIDEGVKDKYGNFFDGEGYNEKGKKKFYKYKAIERPDTENEIPKKKYESLHKSEQNNFVKAGSTEDEEKSNRIQKISSLKGAKAYDNFIKNITDFFTNIGKQIADYIKNFGN